MTSKKYDVITIDKDLAVVVDNPVRAEYGEYGLITNNVKWFIQKLKESDFIPFHVPKVIATIGKQLEGLPLVVLPEKRIDFETLAEASFVPKKNKEGDEYTQLVGQNPNGWRKHVKSFKAGYKAAQQKGTIVAVTLSLQDNKIIEQDGKINPISITYERTVEGHTGT